MLNSSVTEFSGLKCRVIDALPTGTAPEIVVVLCHGFGASGDDLAAFGPHLIGSSEAIAARCRFVFPGAPIDLGPMGMPDGKAWWAINMSRLAMINQTQEYEKLTSLEPEGMVEASTQLHEAILQMQAKFDLPASSFVVGGFSQGAMIATDVVLRHKLKPAQLTLFSGTVLCSEDWKAFAADHPGCPVLQSHGRQDMVLPFTPSEWLRDLLSENGFGVSFVPFNGDHTIPMEVLTKLVTVLEEL